MYQENMATNWYPSAVCYFYEISMLHKNWRSMICNTFIFEIFCFMIFHEMATSFLQPTQNIWYHELQQPAHDVWRFWKVCSIVNVNVLISFKVKDTFSHWCGFYISSMYSHFNTLSKQRQIHFTWRRCFIQLHFGK